jgi:hypothetical protein
MSEKWGRVGQTLDSMDWFKGKSTGNHTFSHEIWGFPVIYSLNQSIDGGDMLSKYGISR